MNAISPAFGCTMGGIGVSAALQQILGLVERPLPAETVALGACTGRVLAQAIAARYDLPQFDQSAMDGYAVCTAAIVPGVLVPVKGRTAAGEAPARMPASAVHRILTGAAIPDGADAVIAQEHVHRDGDLLSIGAAPPPGTNLRRRGEDIRAGTYLVDRGAVLDWRHVAVLASQGVSSVLVA